jgi:hypothetical protein
MKRLLILAAGLAAALAVAVTAAAQGVTWQQLQAQGWTCYAPPVGADRIVCFEPGVGRPLPGNPDPAPSYNGLLFSASSGELFLKVHFIRDDLYHGQRCGKDPYIFRALIGYWECVHDI